MPGIIGEIEDIFQRPLCWPDRGRKDSIKVFICQMFFLRKYNCKMAFRNIGEKGSIYFPTYYCFPKAEMEKMIFSSLHEIGHCTTIENIVLHSMAKIAKQNIFSLLSEKRIIAKTSYFTLPIVSQFYRLVK